MSAFDKVIGMKQLKTNCCKFAIWCIIRSVMRLLEPSCRKVFCYTVIRDSAKPLLQSAL